MLGFLRFIGVLNAAVWLGALVFTSFVVLPVFFSPDVTPGLVHRYYSGRIAQMVLHRLFWMQMVCVVIAIAHYIAEWLYAGKPLPRIMVGTLAGLLMLIGVSGFSLEPRMTRWLIVKYASNTTPTEKADATRSFGRWHGVSRVLNLLVIGVSLVHFVRQTQAPAPAKFGRSSRP